MDEDFCNIKKLDDCAFFHKSISPNSAIYAALKLHITNIFYMYI